MQNIIWQDKINMWLSGIPQKYSENITKRFFYETYVCNDKLKNHYEDIYIENDILNKFEQDYSSFIEYINKSKNKYYTYFYNPSKTSLLIIPIPKKNKNYTTIKDFIDNASKYQQVEFWKGVGKLIKKILENYSKIYVSTHGLGVPYFHLRLDTEPKYYKTKEFI